MKLSMAQTVILCHIESFKYFPGVLGPWTEKLEGEGSTNRRKKRESQKEATTFCSRHLEFFIFLAPFCNNVVL